MAIVFAEPFVSHFSPGTFGQTDIVVVLFVLTTDRSKDTGTAAIVIGHAGAIITALIRITIVIVLAGLLAHNFAATINTLGSAAWCTYKWAIGIGPTFGSIIVCALADIAAILVLG